LYGLLTAGGSLSTVNCRRPTRKELQVQCLTAYKKGKGQEKWQ